MSFWRALFHTYIRAAVRLVALSAFWLLVKAFAKSMFLTIEFVAMLGLLVVWTAATHFTATVSLERESNRWWMVALNCLFFAGMFLVPSAWRQEGGAELGFAVLGSYVVSTALSALWIATERGLGQSVEDPLPARFVRLAVRMVVAFALTVPMIVAIALFGNGVRHQLSLNEAFSEVLSLAQAASDHPVVLIFLFWLTLAMSFIAWWGWRRRA